MANEIVATPKRTAENNYGLKNYDIVSMSGAVSSPLAKVIRWQAAGFKNRNNYDIPTHTGMVIKNGKKLQMVEMLEDGLKYRDLNPNGKYKFHKVTRLNLSPLEKNKLKRSIDQDIARGVKYDLNPISLGAKYLWGGKNQQGKKGIKSAVCSEYIVDKLNTTTKFKQLTGDYSAVPADFVSEKKFTVEKPVKKDTIKIMKFKDLNKTAASKFDKVFSKATDAMKTRMLGRVS